MCLPSAFSCKEFTKRSCFSWSDERPVTRCRQHDPLVGGVLVPEALFGLPLCWLHCGGAASLVPEHLAASACDQLYSGRGAWGGAHLGALCSGPAAGGFVYAVAKLNGAHISPGREASAHHTAGWSCIHKSLCPTTRLQETQDAVGSSCWWILPSLHTFPLELVRRCLSNPVYHLTPSSESSNSLVPSSLC